jgi:hypothetical protein
VPLIHNAIENDTEYECYKTKLVFYNIHKLQVEYGKLICTVRLNFYSLAVTLRTTRFNIKKILRGAHIAFMCFVRITEQTATFAL